MDSKAPQIQHSLNALMAHSRSNKRKTFLLISIALSSLSGGILQFFPSIESFIFVIMILIFIFSYVFQIKSHSYSAINKNAMFEHINCTFSEFEQSSQLLIDENPSSILKQLQKKKIEFKFSQQDILNDIVKSLQPVQYRPAFQILLISIIVFAVQKFTVEISTINQTKISAPIASQSLTQELLAPVLVFSNVTITPPEYTHAKIKNTQNLNLNLLEGSNVRWQLKFSRKDLSYFMVDADGHRTEFKNTDNASRVLSQSFSQTSLYSFAYLDNGVFKSLDGVYTLEVVLDELPRIKILQPKQSLLEIPKQGPATFELIVEITDDFGLSNTIIQASVASGSGEAVKFRDEIFHFDEVTPIKNGSKFRKFWRLKDLKMEPGDEVYFKVIAKDNKQPTSQQVKSSSVIVRWLDNEIQELSAEGLRIHFIAEYFRSQRQIIIETEQLIEDRNNLSRQQFDEVSQSLGYSQNDLKSKYGQYLGDEVGEGPGEHMVGVESTEAVELHHDEEDSDQQPEIGHVHEGMVDHNDRSGASEMISRFAHNHGGTEIGPISKLDPKTMMKKAVHEMWQAELHLMLSEPEKALDYENKAYDYLKLATAAERVYVKRLGFEPPPVNEDTRLTGDLKSILSYSNQVEDKLDDKSDAVLYQRVFSILSTNEASILSSRELEMLKQLKQRLLVLSETRPVLIKQAATIERLLSYKRIELKKCKDCISSLKQKIWQLMSAVKSRPNISNTPFNPILDLHYQTKVQALKKTSQPGSGDSNE